MLPKSSFRAFVILALMACLGVAAGPVFAQDEIEKPAPKQDEGVDEKSDEKERTPELLGRPKDDENPLFKLVDEVTEGMKQIEDLLNQKNTSSSTQSLQGQTINKLEELIKEMEKQ